MNMLSAILKNTTAVAAAVQKANAGDVPNNKGNMLDNADNSEVPDVVYTEAMRLDAMHVIAEWAQTETLGDDEGYGDRLLALVVGTAADSDTDLTQDEVEYAGMIAELVGDYLADKGIPEDDLDALFTDAGFDNDVAERVHEALLDKLPDGEDAMTDDAGRFVDGEDDDTMLDATYRKKIVVRGGKKIRINKRIAGTVRLTAAQKSAVRKMQRKAFSGGAKIKRAKSMRLRKKMGM